MDKADIEDMFASIGTVTIKRMFGGKGVYADGRILAIELNGEMLLKGDDKSGPLYAEAGGRHWTYTHNKTGKEVAMPYWSVPEDAFDDSDEMAKWVRMAYETALRAK